MITTKEQNRSLAHPTEPIDRDLKLSTNTGDTMNDQKNKRKESGEPEETTNSSKNSKVDQTIFLFNQN